MRSGVPAVVLVMMGALLHTSVVMAELPAVVSERIAKAKAYVKLVEMSALKTAIDEKLPVLVLDVREPSEFDKEHIPGAINLPRGLLEFKIWKVVGGEPPDTTRTIYIYCATAGRSALAAETLTQLGFSNVYLVNMQLKEWKEAGYPLAESVP